MLEKEAAPLLLPPPPPLLLTFLKILLIIQCWGRVEEPSHLTPEEGTPARVDDLAVYGVPVYPVAASVHLYHGITQPAT